MNTCHVATYTGYDSGGCPEIKLVGIFSSLKNARVGIQKWKRKRTLRPTHSFAISTHELDVISGPCALEITHPFKKTQNIRIPLAWSAKSRRYQLPKPIYHAFPIVHETLTDGWLFGAITVYEDPDGCKSGDGFVVAPDGSRAGLDWHVGRGKIKQVAKPDEHQWGVYDVFFPKPVRTTADLVKNFRAVLPQVKKVYDTLKRAEPKQDWMVEPIECLPLNANKPSAKKAKPTDALAAKDAESKIAAKRKKRPRNNPRSKPLPPGAIKLGPRDYALDKLATPAV